MAHAGFLRRLLAYLIDAIPITVVVASVHFAFLGFDGAVERYLQNGPRDREARAVFLAHQREIRNTSLVVYVVYASFLEASALRGTLGKWLLGIAVADRDGNPVGFTAAVVRNICKPLSFLPCGLGCLWVVFNSEKRAWHDLIAGTVVLLREDGESQVESVR